MNSATNQETSPIKSENSSSLSKNDVINTSPKKSDDIKTSTEKSNVVKPEEEDNNLIEDLLEIDLSAIEVASGVLEQMENSMKSKEPYNDLMGACSSTAQALKQTISDVLRTRENIVITAGDTTNELEASLSQKIADFEDVVSGCFVPKDAKTDLTNIKHPAFSNVIITEVDESSEESNSANSTTQILEEKSDSNISSANTSELITDSKALPQTNKTGESGKSSSEHSVKKENNKESKGAKVPHVQTETVPVLNSFGEDKSTKKQKSNPNKKKGEKAVEQILKSLSSCSSTEEKLQTLSKRHAETLDELKLFEPRMKQLERQVIAQQKEKEQLQTEHNRMILAKSTLEGLCRELQRQNKAVKEESLLRLKEEEERRKEIANKFQGTLNDISALMQEHSKKNIQLREENAELAKKLKALVDHYDMWEKHMEKVVQQNHLEAQLAKAKHAKINLQLKQETEKFLREKQSLLENMSELQKKCTLLTSNELKLRTELGDYTSKYEEFQSVLNKSSEVFASFKNDMESTSKKIKKLEKETNVYRQKWESSNNALLGMINDKEKHDKELSNAHQRISTLEKLCRALQAERNELRNQLNAVSGTSKKDVSQPATEAQVA